MPKKRLKTLVITGFSAFYSFLSVKLGIILEEIEKCKSFLRIFLMTFSGPAQEMEIGRKAIHGSD